MRVFPKRKTDADLVEEAYRQVRFYERWGRTGGFFVLGLTALYLSLAYGIAEVGWEMAEQARKMNRAPGLQGGFPVGLSVGIGWGVVAGLIATKGLSLIKQAFTCFTGGDRQARLLVKYHEAWESMVDEEKEVSPVEVNATPQLNEVGERRP